MRCDMAHRFRIGANGDAENHAIAAFNGARGIRFHHIGQAQFTHARERLRPARCHHQSLRDIAALLCNARNGRPNKPNTNQAKPIEQRFSHVAQ